MLPARRAGLQTLNSTREKTDCTSLLATPVDLVAVLLPSRLVSPLKSARDADNRAKGMDSILVINHGILASQVVPGAGYGGIPSIGYGRHSRLQR
jgi:hypothetical protein